MNISREELVGEQQVRHYLIEPVEDDDGGTSVKVDTYTCDIFYVVARDWAQYGSSVKEIIPQDCSLSLFAYSRMLKIWSLLPEWLYF